MQKRQLGNSGIEFQPSDSGAWAELRLWPPADKGEMIALIHSAIDRGVTFFDTAECYGPLTNEELVGEALDLS